MINLDSKKELDKQRLLMRQRRSEELGRDIAATILSVGRIAIWLLLICSSIKILFYM